ITMGAHWCLLAELRHATTGTVLPPTVNVTGTSCPPAGTIGGAATVGLVGVVGPRVGPLFRAPGGTTRAAGVEGPARISITASSRRAAISRAWELGGRAARPSSSQGYGRRPAGCVPAWPSRRGHRLGRPNEADPGQGDRRRSRSLHGRD